MAIGGFQRSRKKEENSSEFSEAPFEIFISIGVVHNNYVLRDFLILGEDDRIVEPRAFMDDAVPEDNAWMCERYMYNRIHHYHKSGKSSWGGRRLKYYKRDLKDQAWEKSAITDWHCKTKHHTPNAWDLEPARRNSACWKDQSKRRHQYKKQNWNHPSSVFVVAPAC